MAREQASVGSAQYYGPRETNEGLPNSVATYGVVRQLEVYFDFADVNAGLPTANADTDAGTLLIPAGSLVKDVYIEVSTAFVSGTPTTDTVLIGVESASGGTVDADGFFAVATVNPADLTVGWIKGDGALIGKTVGTVAVQVSLDTGVGTLTAGKGRLVVEYIDATAA